MLVAYIICLLVISHRQQLMLTILFAVALLFPIAFYHYSWSFWLGFDYLVESLPKYVKRDSA